MIQTTNEELRDSVLAELDADPRIDSQHIGVAAEDGVVTLTGTVTSVAQKWSAEEAAKRVKGVRAVAEELKVDLPETHHRDDADIARDIAGALYWDTLLPATIQCVVQNAYVSLTGQVDWNYQREEAEETARRVAGVRGISNTIVIRKNIAEEDIRRQIQRLFHRDAQIDANSVHIEVTGGTVKLTGTVHSRFERDEAGRAAWAIKGVSAVENQIAIAP
jgi:osmotically-inducible protein OsmY